jgi:outer membrane protein assembly factor BamB
MKAVALTVTLGFLLFSLFNSRGDSAIDARLPSLQPSNLTNNSNPSSGPLVVHEDWFFRETKYDTKFASEFPFVYTVKKDRVLCDDGDAVYVRRPKDFFSKLDAKTGAILWTAHLKGAPTQAKLTEDHVEVETVAMNSADPKCIGHIFLSIRTGGIINVGSSEELRMPRDGIRRLTESNSMTLADTTVKNLKSSGAHYLYSDDGTLYAPDSTNGPLFVSFDLIRKDQRAYCGLANSSNMFWLASYSPEGRMLWIQPLRTLSFVGAVSSNLLILSCDLTRNFFGPHQTSNVVFAVQKGNGQPVWEYVFSPDDSHGTQHVSITLLNEYVGIVGKNFARPDRPFRTGDSDELNLTLLDADTGVEKCFYRFTGIHGQINFGKNHIFVEEEESGLHCYSIGY